MYRLSLPPHYSELMIMYVCLSMMCSICVQCFPHILPGESSSPPPAISSSPISGLSVNCGFPVCVISALFPAASPPCLIFNDGVLVVIQMTHSLRGAMCASEMCICNQLFVDGARDSLLYPHTCFVPYHLCCLI